MTVISSNSLRGRSRQLRRYPADPAVAFAQVSLPKGERSRGKPVFSNLQMGFADVPESIIARLASVNWVHAAQSLPAHAKKSPGLALLLSFWARLPKAAHYG
jgi:hypothetical protein